MSETIWYQATDAHRAVAQPQVTYALRQVSVLRGLGPDTTDALATHGHALQAQPGEILLTPGTDVDYVYIVLAGALRLYRCSNGGAELTTMIYQVHDLFGLAHLQPGAPMHAYLQVMHNRALVFQFSLAYLRALMERDASVAASVARYLGAKLQEADDRTERFAFANVNQRLAHVLLQLTADSPDSPLAATHEDLASLIGASREEVTRTLCRLRRRGVLESHQHRKGVHILDRNALQADLTVFGGM